MFQVSGCFGLVEGYSFQFLQLEKKWIKCFRSSTHQYQVVHCWLMSNLTFIESRGHHLEGRNLLSSFSKFRRFLLAQSSWLLRSLDWSSASHSSSQVLCCLQFYWGYTVDISPSPCQRCWMIDSQILDKTVLKIIEVWFERCSWLPVSGIKNRLPSFWCCLSYKLLTSVWLFPLVQRQESFIKGDVKL